MAIYTSSTNRVTGLSGLDTESMIDKMMNAESARYDSMERDQIFLSWRQEAYRDVIGKLQDFQDKWFGIDKSTNIGYDSSWNKYDFSVKDSTGNKSNSITINNSTANGNYKIEVTQAAQTESLTGNSTTESNITTGSTADDIAKNIQGIGNGKGELTLEFNLDGQTKKITISGNDINKATTGKDDGEKLVSALQEKLKTAFGTADGTTNPKVTVTKNTDGKIEFKAGAGNNLSLSNNNGVTDGTTAKDAGALDSSKVGTYKLDITIGNDVYNVEANFEAKDKPEDRINKINEALKKAKKAGSTTEEDISGKISFSMEAKGNDLVFTSTSRDKDVKIETSLAGATGIASGTTLKTSSSLHYLGLTSSKSTSVSGYTSLKDAFGKKFDDFFTKNKNQDDVVKLNFGGKEISVKETETIDSLLNQINDSDSGIKVSFNDVTGRFTMESKNSGKNGNIDIKDDSSTAKVNEVDFLKNFLGIDVADKSKNAVYTKGQDSKFKVNGVEATKPTNEITMNGISFTINSKTAGEVTISSSTNQDDTVKMVKDFVDGYNKLIGDIESLIKQPREKSGKYDYYDPLLDKEKDEMSDDEIKKWEEKAKKGLLYRDEFLSDILDDFRKVPFSKIDIGGGKSLSLYEIGISSTNYSTNKLSIDESKLKDTLLKRGDDVRKLFTSKDSVSSKMDSIIDGMIGRDGLLRNKAGIKNTISERNNMISDSISDIKSRRDAERKRLQKKEMQYFDMFARMEAVMNKQNNQMGMLLSSLGQM